MEHTQQMLAVLSSIFLLGIGAQWLAWRLKVPGILLLLGVGCVAGSLTGWINPEKVFGDLLLPMVSLSVGLILFEGGLNLQFRELKGAWRSLIGLLTVGVIVTWIGVTIGGVWILHLPFPESLVLGAVLTVTGPTVVGPMLREIRPTGRVGAIAKWEGITIDPIGAIFSLLVFEAVDSIRQAEFGSATVNAAIGLLTVLAIGLAVGLGAAWILIIMTKSYWIPDYQHNSMTLWFVVAAFTVADLLHHEAGLLAVTVMGITLANQRQIQVHRTIEFKESLTLLLIATLFILLTARVSFESLASLGWRGPAFATFLILIVRPVAVWLATMGSRLNSKEKIFLSWLAPRGIVAAAVASVFALKLGGPGEALAPAAFIVIFMTVAVYGLTSGWLARRLGLSSTHSQGLLIAGANPIARAIAALLHDKGFEMVLVDTRLPRIRKSQSASLKTCFANILSDHVLDEVDFGGLGRFLAMTANDEVNTLAAARFREIFGGENVFQLSRPNVHLERLDSSWQHRMIGRTLFDQELTYDFLNSTINGGGEIQLIEIGETIELEAFRQGQGRGVWPLFVVNGKQLSVIVSDSKPALKSGQSVVCLLTREALTMKREDAGSDRGSTSLSSVPVAN